MSPEPIVDVDESTHENLDKPIRMRVWRGDAEGGRYVEYEIERTPGLVVLDVIHRIQAEHDPELAVRWNCKAGKCGSCSVEINGMPRLSCMTRMDLFDEDEVLTVAPMKTFPLLKDLVTDVSWNYRVNEQITPFTPRALTAEEQERGEFNMQQIDVDRVQEFRKCIECYLCQDTCHVLRDAHKTTDPSQEGGFHGPRFMIRTASLDMHPKDDADRIKDLKDKGGIGYCNITRCCTEVCPENINITDNGIIPMKERVVDRHYDPVQILWRKVSGGNGKAAGKE